MIGYTKVAVFFKNVWNSVLGIAAEVAVVFFFIIAAFIVCLLWWSFLK